MIDHVSSTSPDPELWDRPKKGPAEELFASIAGYGATISSILRKSVTEQYPEEEVPIAPRYHGRHRLNRYPDSLERCIGCGPCAWACPADAIFIEAASNTPNSQISPDKHYGRVYQINYLYYIFYGFCIQTCPIRALTVTNEYKLADPTREGLVYEKEDLLALMPKGMLAAPHPMAEGTSNVDCCRDEIVDPTAARIEWVTEHRLDDLILAVAISVDAPGPLDAAAVPAGALVDPTAASAGAPGGEYTEGRK